MISVKEAIELILKNTPLLETEEVSLRKTSGRILAEDAISLISHPLFDQSAVDGYAFNYNNLINNKINTSIVVEVKAGDSPKITLKKGETARIFTGAAVPAGADTVVMQEFVEQNGSSIEIQDPKLKKGANIRKKGEQILKGQLALSKGTTLNPAGIGFLASLGINTVKVSRLPKVGIVLTGSEFIAPPLPFRQLAERVPGAGKIYESNGQMLQSALRAMNIFAKDQICEDNPDKLKAVLQKETDSNDIIIITGGVSVGKYDYTKAVLEDIGFETVFHKVLQKPGKPILFAKKTAAGGLKAAFGLPGNPRAVLVCFYEYVYPYIKAIMGSSEPFLTTVQIPLAQDYEKKDDKKVHFLAAQFNGNEIKLLDIQGSHMLQSLSRADGLIVLPENKTTYSKGEWVEVHLLPQMAR